MKFLIKVLITAVNAFVLAYLLPGISINLDAIVKPILVLFTLPATIFTLGLFLFVINACIILLDAYFVKGFVVDGFWYALLFSICLSIINSFVHKMVLNEEGKNKAN